MKRNRHVRDEHLQQALLEWSREEVQRLEQQLQQDPALASQVDALYHRHQRQVAASLRGQKASWGRPVWRYAALAASLVLVILAVLEIGRPREDIVVLTQPTGGFTEEILSPPLATVAPMPTVTASPSPTVLLTPEPTPTHLITPTPEPTPTPLISPTPEPSPVPEAGPAQAPDSRPQWAGSYLPRLPEGYGLAAVSLDREGAAADFRTEDGRSLRFVEYSTAGTIQTGTAGSFSYHRLQGGTTALAWQTGADVLGLVPLFALSGEKPEESLILLMD